MPDFPLKPNRLIGWVLRRHRLRTQSDQGLDTSEFFAGLREQGIKVDASRISRWELGRLSPGARVLAAYELACGLPEYTLRALAAEAHRLVGGTFVSVVDAEATQERAHGVLDEAGAGGNPPIGELFGAIEQSLLQNSARYLSPLFARRIAHTLVGRLDVVRSPDRITHRAAVRAAAHHPRLRGALVVELVDRLTRPHVAVVSDALEMLLLLDAKQAVPVLTSLLGPDSDPDLHPVAACWVRHSLVSSAVDASSRQQLESALHQLAPAEAAPGSLDQQLSRRGAADALHRHLKHAGDVALIEDECSSVLVATALWHGDRHYRHLASLAMISGGVTQGLAPALVELAVSSDPALARRAAALLEYLPHPPAAVLEQASELVADPVIARRLWRSRGHCDEPVKWGAPVETALDDERLAGAALYALAMSGSSDLAGLAADARRPARVVDKANWWLDHGPDEIS